MIGQGDAFGERSSKIPLSNQVEGASPQSLAMNTDLYSL